jgi:heat shock protein HslJ
MLCETRTRRFVSQQIDMKIGLVVSPIAALAAAMVALCAVPSGAQSPADKTWSLEQGRGISAAEPPNQLSLKLEGQRLSGSTGCNSFTATIAETGERVKIENLSLTRKLCAALQNANERAFVSALGQTQYLTKEPEKITFLSDKREPLLVWKSAEAKRGASEGNRDRSLIAPRVTQNEKAATVVADDRNKARPKKPVTRHARRHLNHVAHRHARLHRHLHGHERKHAHRHGHRYGHRHYVRLRRGCHDLF